MLKSKFIFISFLLIFISFLTGCEDPLPDDYTQLNLVEALLIVGKPISEIRITKTLPLKSEYDYFDAIIKDAECFIYEGDIAMQLIYKHSDSAEKCGYFFADTTYLVKPNTTYRLKIILNTSNINNNNKKDTITGTTTTPDNQIAWKKTIEPVIQYPFDTLKLPSSEDARTEWLNNNVRKPFIYLLVSTCLDTLNYGSYLSPPTGEDNERVRRRFEHNNDDNESERRLPEVSMYDMLFVTQSFFDWYLVRWFGPHSLKLYVPDENFEVWIGYYFFAGNFNKKAYSVVGGAGYFGSAVVLESDFFLLKNK